MPGLNETITIRKFEMKDYEAVMSLWEICKLPAKPNGRDSREKISREITKDTAFFIVAEKDGQLIGTVLGTHDGRKGWINRLAVAPAYRHQGLAQLLLQKAESEIHAKGIDIIACLIENHNQTSMDFFQKAGYAKLNTISYFSKRQSAEI